MSQRPKRVGRRVLEETMVAIGLEGVVFGLKVKMGVVGSCSVYPREGKWPVSIAVCRHA
jgi:hypothetical protein